MTMWWFLTRYMALWAHLRPVSNQILLLPGRISLVHMAAVSSEGQTKAIAGVSRSPFGSPLTYMAVDHDTVLFASTACDVPDGLFSPW